MRYKKPDKKNALSIIDAAKRDIEYTLSLKSTEEAGPTIIRNIYECFRMLGDSLLVAKGIDSEGHIEQINELLKVKVTTTRPISILENLRKLRRNINYYGYKPGMAEINDTISIANCCFEPLAKAVLKEIGK